MYFAEHGKSNLYVQTGQKWLGIILFGKQPLKIMSHDR